MEEENKKTSKMDDTINAVANLTKEIPIYQDAVQPVAKQVGKSLETVGKTVNACLAPIRGLVWGAEQMEEFLNRTVSEKLKDIPEKNIETPDPHIAGPLIESLRFTGNNDELKEMYASLLATSMNSETKDKAHPSFVDIIKNMTSDEAKIINYLYKNFQNHGYTAPLINIYEKYETGGRIKHEYVTEIPSLANCTYNKVAYFDNLLRLKLIIIPTTPSAITEPDYYKELMGKDYIKKEIDFINNQKGISCFVDKSYLRLSDYGILFCKSCL